MLGNFFALPSEKRTSQDIDNVSVKTRALSKMANDLVHLTQLFLRYDCSCKH